MQAGPKPHYSRSRLSGVSPVLPPSCRRTLFQNLARLDPTLALPLAYIPASRLPLSLALSYSIQQLPTEELCAIGPVL